MKRLLILCAVFVWSLSGSLWPAELLKPGSKAPAFSATDQHGKVISLSDFTGKKSVVLYFYPKDFTSGCTLEACTFRDNYSKFTDKGVVIIGVSFDTESSHRDFTRANKLLFPLLSDPKGELGAKYGVSSIFGYSSRVTFIIDKKGIIRFVYNSLSNPTLHVEKALNSIDTL